MPGLARHVRPVNRPPPGGGDLHELVAAADVDRAVPALPAVGALPRRVGGVVARQVLYEAEVQRELLDLGAPAAGEVALPAVVAAVPEQTRVRSGDGLAVELRIQQCGLLLRRVVCYLMRCLSGRARTT